MLDGNTAARLRQERIESRPARHVAPETFMEMAEDTIVNWTTNDWADQLRDLHDHDLANIAIYLFNAMRPDVLLLDDMRSGSVEVNVRGTVERIIREQSALAQEEWENSHD